jgi:hypothetical protein
MVLVKDPKQVGKKVDCPNCKFRFLVEDPNAAKEEENAAAETGTEAEAAPKPKANTAVTAKKPTAPAVPAPPAKKKAGPKKPPPKDEDEDGDEPRKKPKGGNLVVILGIGLAALALMVLGVGGYFLFFTGKDDKGSSMVTRPIGPRPGGTVTVPGKKEDDTPKVQLVEITNLLPTDAQSVMNLNVRDLVNGSIGRAAESPGAFKHKFVEQKIGLPLKDIDRLLVAWNKGWTFAVVRTGAKTPINLEAFRAAANLQPGPDSPYKAQEYFVTEPTDWLERVWGAVSGQPSLGGNPRPYAIRMVDAYTLVVSDPDTLKKVFLDEKGQPKQQTKPQAPKGGQPVSNRYLTLKPTLKGLLDVLETKPVLLTWAVDMEPLRGELLPTAVATMKAMNLPVDDRMQTAVGQMRTLGLALQTKDQTAVTLGLDFAEHKMAVETKEIIQSKAEEMAKTNVGGRGNAPAGFPVVEVDNRVVLAPPPPPPPLPPPAPPAPAAEPPAKVTIRSQVQDQALLLTADIVLSQQSNSLRIQQALQPRMVALRGLVEMAVPRPRLHDLAAAVLAMAQKEGKFPRGTFERKPKKTRPYEPADRVGWMVELLPYLDLADVRREIDTDQSWRAEKNAAAAGCLVPAFLDPHTPSFMWLTRSPSMPTRILATTQFVGMAGVGLDAAEYSADDSSVTAKLGIFGYDRETKLDDIKDRTSTIALIQVPGLFRRPWLAGGGATITGVPDTDSIKPFICATYQVGDKKVPGTFAIMADGAVRFIPATISDTTFKALCTIGPKKVELDKETVLVPAPGQAILKAKD